MKQSGIGRDFIVFLSKYQHDTNYCIRVSLGKYGNNVVESEMKKLEMLQDHIKHYHKWIIPKYIDICNIYVPSSSKAKLLSVVYESIGNKIVWNLG